MKQTLLIIALAFSISNIAKDMGYEMAPKDTIPLVGRQCQEVIRSAKKAGISAVNIAKKGLLLTAFSTCMITWESLCGRRGYLVYCEDCHTVIDWRVSAIN